MEGGLLQLRGFTKNYATSRGVGPIDLDLEPGVHGLLGPNGSGKTTLIKTLLGFLTPTGGQAQVLGHDVVHERLQVRRQVGYMAENDVIVPGLNPVQTVRMAAELCGLSAIRAHEAAAEALNAVDMGDERFHSVRRLSTGQRQKVKLASALVHAPRLLFLDEPTNGLDPRGRRAMLALIEEMTREKDISVILSTHILPDVESVCESAVILRDGHLVAVEQVGARTVQKAGRRTWFDVEAIGDHERLLKAFKVAKLDVEVDGRSMRVAATTPKTIINAAKKSDSVLTKLSPRTRGVEDEVLDHMEVDA